MLKHLRPAVLAFSAAALFALPGLAAHTTRHAAAATHTAVAHATVSRVSARKTTHGLHADYVDRTERAAASHHDATPAMDPDRATAIQTALIREGYLSGQPSGVWDADSVAAMQKLQDANGWQTKYTPDSRALLKLGLGGAPVPAPQPAPATETAASTPTARP